MAAELTKSDVSTEQWREYDFNGRVYRIDAPVTLYHRAGGECHRVVDADGIVHLVPSPGSNGCVVRWTNRPGEPEVVF